MPSIGRVFFLLLRGLLLVRFRHLNGCREPIFAMQPQAFRRRSFSCRYRLLSLRQILRHRVLYLPTLKMLHRGVQIAFVAEHLHPPNVGFSFSNRFDVIPLD